MLIWNSQTVLQLLREISRLAYLNHISVNRSCDDFHVLWFGHATLSDVWRVKYFVIFPTLFHRCNFTHPPWTQIFSNSFQIIFYTTRPPLDKQMATHDSHRASILLPPPNSVQSLHSMLLLESKSTPARHHQLTSRLVCSIPGRWSIRHHYSTT